MIRTSSSLARPVGPGGRSLVRLSQIRMAASSAVGRRCQADATGNDLSRDNVHLERDGCETCRQKLDPVRTCRKPQWLGGAERARHAYVAVIDVDKGVGWSDVEIDTAVLGFSWRVIRGVNRSA